MEKEYILTLHRCVTRLGVNRVKPWNSARINLVLVLRGPDIRLGLDNRHLIIKGHRGLKRG